MKVLVKNMTVAQLNYCVADLLGHVFHYEAGHGVIKVKGYIFSPCESWSACGQLVDHLLRQNYSIEEAIFSGSIKVMRTTGPRVVCSYGATAKIAICRAYVTLKRGTEAEVPDDLATTVEVAQA